MTGSFGFLWLILWLVFYRLPEHHARIGTEERDFILAGQTKVERAARGPSIAELMHHQGVWGIVLARFFADAVWWFYLIWLPLYLHTTRGFTLKDIGLFVWIPYAAADAGASWADGFPAISLTEAGGSTRREPRRSSSALSWRPRAFSSPAFGLP